jgi:hypothetical protein
MDNDIFNNLRVLNLEGNPIEHWEEVNKLGQLPKYIFYTFFFVNYLILMEIYLIFSLEQLSLYGCGLKNIQVKEKSFSKLSKLSLSNNKISQVYIIYF